MITIDQSAKIQLFNKIGSLSDKYLFPLTFFQIGIDNGYLEIEDDSFYDTVQGSMYSAYLDLDVETINTKGIYNNVLIVGDLFICLDNDSDTARLMSCMIPLQAVNIEDDRKAILSNLRIQSRWYKTPIPYYPMYFVDRPNEWKNYSNGLIQMFKGCHVKMKKSVWKTGVIREQLYSDTRTQEVILNS